MLHGIDGERNDNLETVIESVEDDRLEIVNNIENRGLAATLNDLLEMCRNDGNEFIACMDSDDIAVLDRFEKQLSFLWKHTDVDVVAAPSMRLIVMESVEAR